MLVAPELLKPVFADLGFGFSVDMDKQQLEPVARLKIKDWVSIKVCPGNATICGP